MEIGFEGGNVLRVTVEQAAGDALVAAISGGQDEWQRFEADEGTFWINPDELCFIRLAPEDAPHVGFGPG